jgi:hypothetical protein
MLAASDDSFVELELPFIDGPPFHLPPLPTPLPSKGYGCVDLEDLSLRNVLNYEDIVQRQRHVGQASSGHPPSITRLFSLMTADEH